MDNIYSLNVERAVLSSIFFDNEQFSSVINIIKPKDFYLPAHRKIFEGMDKLHKEDLPIDEEFIRNKVSAKDVDDSIIIEILSANAISNIMAYVSEIKETSVKRDLIHLASDIKNVTIEQDLSATKALDLIKGKLETISQQSTVSLDWASAIKKKVVTRSVIKEVENARFLVDGVLPYGGITTFVGVPNVGKSAVSMSMANMLLKANTIDSLIYFDADNPLIYVKNRIEALFDNFDEDKINYFTGSTASKLDMISVLKTLAMLKGGGEKVLIVIDSLKNFIDGSINEDKPVNDLFDLLQQVRDNFKCTIIVLHHTRKGTDESGNLNYVGSQVILASSDNLTYISKDEVSKDLLFDNDKARALIPTKLAFELDFENMELKGAELPVDEVDNSKADALKIIIDLLVKNSGMGIKELKKELAPILKAKGVDEILKDKKQFRMIRNSDDGWRVMIREDESIGNEPKVTVFNSEPELNVNELESLGL